ncbi:MAG: desulfoferrodoxin family protein [Oleiphilaceae bacterium]|nr:desulfoferrodoxin family protein [Oleiphilaceae bacterium]
MSDESRRSFLKTAAVGTAAVAATAMAGSATAADAPLVYSKGKAGDYEGKTGSHAPVITVEGSKVTVTTKHEMTPHHYIALHSLQGAATYFGSYEFGIKDLGEGKVAVSTYDIGSYTGPLKAISVCNLHDVWISEGKA